MKKFFFTILLISALFLSACSKQQDSTAFPEDLIVVLPDGKELSLYMPHDDAAEILGVADYTDTDLFGGKMYIYEDLGLETGYNEGLLAYISIDETSPCTLKNGLNPSSGKSDFVKAGFSDNPYGIKYYSISEQHYIPSAEPPEAEFSFRSVATVFVYPGYKEADSPYFDGYSITVNDGYCSIYGWN
jgi:hypothetical protein